MVPRAIVKGCFSGNSNSCRDNFISVVYLCFYRINQRTGIFTENITSGQIPFRLNAILLFPVSLFIGIATINGYPNKPAIMRGIRHGKIKIPLGFHGRQFNVINPLNLSTTQLITVNETIREAAVKKPPILPE